MKAKLTKTLLTLALLTAWSTAVSPAWGSPGLSDETVAGKVADRLDRKGLRSDNDIRLIVEDGVVYMGGSVETLRQAQKAEKVAANTKGVLDVDAKLRVTSFGRPDAAIRGELQQILDVELNTEPFDWVEAMVESGQVLLTGQVYNPVTLSRISKAIAGVPGVWRIEESVEVAPVSLFDDELRRAALYSLYTHPAFSDGALSGRPTIHILVANGRITLKGTVSSKVQARLAESLVRSSSTNYGVDNQIFVTRRQRS